MNILIFEWGTYTHTDILNELKKQGHNCDVVIKHSFKDKNQDDVFKRDFTGRIKNGHYDLVYSTNYFPLVAECCNEQGNKYISWSYDSPINVSDIERTLGLPCNYVFMYDREEALYYRNKGFDNVFHLPLAVNTDRYDNISLNETDFRKYTSQISFVGNLYQSEMLNIRSILSDYYKGYLDSVMKVQSKIYGYYIIDDLLSDNVIEGINDNIYDSSMQKRYGGTDQRGENKEKPVFKVNKRALSYALGAQVTREERLLILKLLSNHYEVKLYSKEDNDFFDKIKFMGRVDYESEMPKVFKASAINLNITLRCIRSGIPLRALDIMGTGGFLMSNYQQELAESFIDGEELVMYESIEDMYEKVKYYLNNEDRRRIIAFNGYNRVKRDFRYEDRIRFMFKTAGVI